MDALLDSKQQKKIQSTTKKDSEHNKTRNKLVRRKTVILAPIIVVIVIAVVTVSFFGQQLQVKDLVTIERASVEIGSLANSIEGAGTLSNSGTNAIYVPSNLEIEEVLVEPGDSVVEGDVLAKVGQTSLNIERYTVAERLKELNDEMGTIKKDTANYYTLLKEQKKLQDKRVILDEIAADNTIRVTKSGVIDKVNVRAGLTVGAGVKAAEMSGDESMGTANESNSYDNESSGGAKDSGTASGSGAPDSPSGSTGDALQDTHSATEMLEGFKVASSESMTLSLNLDELDILSIKPKQKVSLTIHALAGQTFEGEIARIAKQATSNDGVTKYSVDVTLPKTKDMLAGMNAAASIAINESVDVLTIPSAALRQQGTRNFVYTAKDARSGELSGEVDVEIGNSDGLVVEVLSGLSQGDILYFEAPVSTGGR